MIPIHTEIEGEREMDKLFSPTWEPLGELISPVPGRYWTGPLLEAWGRQGLGVLGTETAGGLSGRWLAPPAISPLLSPSYSQPREASRRSPPALSRGRAQENPSLMEPQVLFLKEDRSLQQPAEETARMHGKC